MKTVVLKVTRISVKTRFSEKALDLEPVGDLLYGVEVPADGFAVTEEGKEVFTLAGIRHLVKSGLVALVIDADQADF